MELTSSHGHNESTTMYGRVSSGKNLKTSGAIPLHGTKERKTTVKQIGEAETQSRHKPYPTWSNPQSRGNLKATNGRGLCEEQRVHTPHGALQLLRQAPKRQTPKTTGYEEQWGCLAQETWGTKAN